ncbi:unnamed protein product [Euphydryas editha]|uniref:Disks large-associated protein 5 n=1 Tax=Euphydryas editha TaxID=104508 RepID=A0AAU9TYV9_EUPED|nr:unnamed protein product [Euphydryas editha]
MEKSFDFGALLQNHEKKHKSKPTQFVSVAGGVKKRLENSIKNRKSTRLSVFDKIRNLPKAESPAPVNKVQSKVEHRRIQLEKWKEEKERKRKEASLQKKKPFVAGVPHNPLKFVPPPPPPKALPSTSGRVTRSQSAKNFTSNITKQKSTKTDSKQSKNQSQSFAPINATFKPPIFKNMIKLPTLSHPKQADKRNAEQVLPSKEVKSKLKSKNVPKHEPRTLRSRPQLTEKSNNKSKKALSPIKSLSSNSSSSMESTTDEKPTVKSKASRKPTNTSKKAFSPKKTFSSNSSSSMESSTDEKSTVQIKTSRKSNNKSTKAFSPTKSHSSNSSLCMESSTDEKSTVESKTSRKSIENDLIIFTPKNKVPKSESNSEEKLRSPKSMDLPMTPEQIIEEAKKISPCVTLSRGKDNARKEMKRKLDEGLFEEDLCEIDSVEHFRKQLHSEIKRMTEMCETWDKISEQVQLPEAVQEAVLGAVGQARLLMSQKLQQFASLLARCECPDPSQALVTPGDLHGFWDMVFMQIENVDMRFKKLEEMRARGWVDEERPAEVKKKVTKPVVNRSKPAVSSRLKDIIAAARKAKKEQQIENPNPPENPPAESKTFEAGFFSVHSPVKSIQSTPVGKPSLLKAVLSNEAKKSATKNSASFAMLRASLIGKNIENNDTSSVQDLVPLTPINLDATPARSILKSTKKSGKKSIKVVLFDESDSDITESNKLNDSNISGVEKIESDHNISNEKVPEGKENKTKESSRRRSKLIRQDATEDRSPVMTRSRRKSIQTPNIEDGKEKSGRKKALQELEMNVEDVKGSSRRSSRRKSSNIHDVLA